MTRIRIRRILANLALLTVSIAFVLGSGELVLRLFPNLMTEEALLRVHWSRLVDRPTRAVADPYIGFLYPPHEEAEQGRGEARFRYALDERGFRNAGPWPDSADVVVLGDSWTFGYGASAADGWVAQLQERLQPSRVINLGLIGSAPEQSARVFETFGAALHPKLVIFGLFPGNDLQDTRTFARWIDEGRPGNYAEWRFFGSNNPSWPAALQRRSYLWALVADLVKNRGADFSGTTITVSNGDRLRLTPTIVAKQALIARPDNPYFRAAIAAILRTRELAADAGADFVVVLYPTKEEIYLPVLGKPTPDAMSPFMTSLEENEIPYIDLRPAMQKHARAGERLYFEVDGHANRTGYRVIADTVGTWVSERLRGASTADADDDDYIEAQSSDGISLRSDP